MQQRLVANAKCDFYQSAITPAPSMVATGDKFCTRLAIFLRKDMEYRFPIHFQIAAQNSNELLPFEQISGPLK